MAARPISLTDRGSGGGRAVSPVKRAASLPSALAALALSACAVVPDVPGPQEQFFQRVMALCGNSYSGRVVTSDPQDRALAAGRLVMHVRTCSAQEIRIPFHAGTDRSRIWVISRMAGGLSLKHVHRHEDGSEAALSRYGGDAVAPGNPRRQRFLADSYSRELFVREEIPAATANVWAIEVVPGQIFAYELQRPGRHFRVEFDLTRPVAPPPPPWGES